ncbi:MAG: ABC transporter ATP-binding protein [Litorimonas sp.]
MNTDTVLEIRDVKFGYDRFEDLIQIETLSIARGESVFLRGPSGSGKSTLLGLIGGVLHPRAGNISICGTDLTTLSPGRRDKVRADHIGIIFQQLNLLPYLNITQNVTLPCRFSSKRTNRAKSETGSVGDTAKNLIKNLGLDETFAERKVGNLSIGQQQRVAVARALIGGPDLIIADEPTSALDSDNRDRFIELLDTQRKRFDCSLLFVSHDLSLAKHFDRSIDLTTLNKVTTP